MCFGAAACTRDRDLVDPHCADPYHAFKCAVFDLYRTPPDGAEARVKTFTAGDK